VLFNTVYGVVTEGCCSDTETGCGGGYGAGYLTEGGILDTVYGVVTEGRCSDTETGCGWGMVRDT